MESYKKECEVGRLPFEKIKLRWIMWLAGKLPPCRDITEMVSQSLEEKPTLWQQFIIRLHFSICIWCSRYRDQLLFMRQSIRHQSADSIKENDKQTDALSAEARERLKRALNRKT